MTSLSRFGEAALDVEVFRIKGGFQWKLQKDDDDDGGTALIAADVSHDEIRRVTLILAAYPPAHAPQPGFLLGTSSPFTSDDLFIHFALPGHTLKIPCAIH